MMKRPLDPHGQPAPDPSITVEEFRAQFTEEMRGDLADGLDLLYQHHFFQNKLQGMTPNEAGKKASEQTRRSRRALQLLAELHPQPYGW